MKRIGIISHYHDANIMTDRVQEINGFQNDYYIVFYPHDMVISRVLILFPRRNPLKILSSPWFGILAFKS